MNHYLSRNKKELILIVISLLCCFMSYAYRNHYVVFSGDFTMRFTDADDYMMMVRLRDFFLHGDLAYSLINRVNVPFGVDIYWTRLYDFFLIIPIWFVNLFFNSISDSIECICFFISPIIKSFLCIVVYKFFQKIMMKSDAFLGGLLFAITPYFAEYSEFGRPDHHVFICALEIIYLYTLLEIIQSDSKNKTDFIKSGIVSVLCIWASIETLSLILLAEAILFFFYYGDIEKLKLLYVKTITATAIISVVVLFSTSITLSYIISFIFLLSLTLKTIIYKQKIWDAFLIVPLTFFFLADNSFAYDKISIMHLVLYLCATSFLLIIIAYTKYFHKNSIKLSGVVICIMSAIFLYRYPNFLLGISGGASDLLRNSWFPDIQDLTSPFDKKIEAYCFCAYAIIFFIATYNKSCFLLSKKRENTDTFWWLLIIVNIVYFFFSCIVRRLIPFSATISLALIVDLGLKGLASKYLSRKTNVCITCMLLLVPSINQKYNKMITDLLFNFDRFKKIIREAQYSLHCTDKIYKFLDNISDTPIVIMSTPYLGPKLLYYTKHNVVAVPFHSQENGIISSLITTTQLHINEEKTKSILKSTNSAYIFSKKALHGFYTPYFNVIKSLTYGNIPPWIEPLELPVENSTYILAKINKDEL